MNCRWVNFAADKGQIWNPVHISADASISLACSLASITSRFRLKNIQGLGKDMHKIGETREL